MNIGELGEEIVSHWLEGQGWFILEHRWHCPWGEIDLIAQLKSADTIVFVEVKTRSRGNWDADGVLSITSQKQAKILRTASMFITEYPNFANWNCRFDVALVGYQKRQRQLDCQLDKNDTQPIAQIGQPVFWQGYQFTLHNYIESAFDGNEDY